MRTSPSEGLPTQDSVCRFHKLVCCRSAAAAAAIPFAAPVAASFAAIAITSLAHSASAFSSSWQEPLLSNASANERHAIHWTTICLKTHEHVMDYLTSCVE
jgi:hypothetical protein